MVDCSSFVIMEERSVSYALALDRHFNQAGYLPLIAKTKKGAWEKTYISLPFIGAP